MATAHQREPIPPRPDALVFTDLQRVMRVLRGVDRVTVLLDAGYYLPLRAAESIPAQLSERVGAQLTQYGNVGPLTVAHLAEATITAARLANIR